MSKQTVDINTTIADVTRLLEEDKTISPGLSAAVKMLIMVVGILTDRAGLNSTNSSIPPASDPNRTKTSRTKSDRTAGGQNGHVGTTLNKIKEPDEIKHIEIDRRSLPKGDYSDAGFETRQVFDIRISRHVIEYRAQVLKNQDGKRFVAEFPGDVNRSVQYGGSIKANAVYMSMFQLIPYERIQTHFREMFDIPISAGSLYNFNADAAQRLQPFLSLVKNQLSFGEDVIHADETGINVGGKRLWLHCASNERWTLLSPHAKRGQIAIDEIGVLPRFSGYLVHDHWKPYYKYTNCVHVLCNAHHQRELTCAHEQDGQAWAKEIANVLEQINTEMKNSGGKLSPDESDKWRDEYRKILTAAELECPPPVPDPDKKTKGKLARSKSRNLLERLRKYEEDVLRFMDHQAVPYTNNQGERDLRMAKVQQKISGCFRSMQGAENYSVIRSYLSTCQKNQVGVGEALERLFEGRWPDFIQEKLNILSVPAE